MTVVATIEQEAEVIDDLPKILKADLADGEALELSLDEEGEQAFLRLTKSLVPASVLLSEAAESLAGLHCDFVVVGEGVEIDKADLLQVIKDLDTVAAQISDPETRDYITKVADRLRTGLAISQFKAGHDTKKLILEIQGEAEGLENMLLHMAKIAGFGHSFPVVVDPDDTEFRKEFSFDGDGQFRLTVSKAEGDLTTEDLSTEGGLRPVGSFNETLIPRFVIEREEDGEDHTYLVRDSKTGKVIARGLSEQDAFDLAQRRNVALRKALGEKIGIFLRVPDELAETLPSISDRDPSPPHATMLIVGQVDSTQFEDMIKAVQGVVKGIESFKVELADFGEFKNKKGETISHLIPRSHGDVTLAEIHRDLREAIVKLGIDPAHHDGPFKPHVTIAYLPPGETFQGDRPEGEFNATHLEIWGEPGGEFGKVTIEFGTGDQQVLTKTGKSHRFRILKQDDDEEEEHTVFGIVLEPEVVDSQGDIYSAEEIRLTAYRFMERYQQFGLQHEDLIPEIFPLESFIAPVDFEVGGQKVKKGTWLLRVRVLDTDIWLRVKSGELTGFSIGGSAMRTPELLRLAA